MHFRETLFYKNVLVSRQILGIRLAFNKLPVLWKLLLTAHSSLLHVLWQLITRRHRGTLAAFLL